MEVAPVSGIAKEIRRVSDPDKAQIIWDGIKVRENVVHSNVHSPFLGRLYGHRNRSQPCPGYLAT